MDSLTQAALGAAVGHTLLGKKLGKAAPIWGAALGTLPDLDVLISFGGEVENFTYHRSFSHSLIVQLAIAPLITWLICKYRRNNEVSFKQWLVAILAILWTHSFLDTFTVYGTQLLWPLSEYPFGLSSIFIIDPLYTVPILMGLALASKQGWTSKSAQFASIGALAISTSYLAWGLIGKQIAENKIAQAWIDQGHQSDSIVSVLSNPMPVNSLLWRFVINEGERYHIAHVGIWESPDAVKFKSYEKGENLLKGLEDEWDVKRLVWFTKGFYRAQIREGQIVISDLRMGVEGSYAFNFAVANYLSSSELQAIKAIHFEEPIDWTKFSLLWDRIWDPSTSLHPQVAKIPKLKSPLGKIYESDIM